MPPGSFAWDLTQLADDIWTASYPVRFAGAWFPHVMTVIRLPDGSLLLHSPCRYTPELADAVEKIGTVAHIVAPNWFHDLYLREYKAAYPQATMWGPKPLEGPFPWTDSLSTHRIRGFLTFDETLFYHKKSATLIVADFLMHLIIADDVPFFTRAAFKLSGAENRLCVFPLLRFAFTDMRSMRAAARQMLAWTPQNLIVAHGSPIEGNATSLLGSALSWLSGK